MVNPNRFSELVIGWRCFSGIACLYDNITPVGGALMGKSIRCKKWTNFFYYE
jgi:hypothetical protein